MRQPLLQGAGTQFNRIAGPGATPGSVQRRDARADQHRHRLGQLRDRRAELRQRRGSRLLGVVFRLPRLRHGQDRARRRLGDVAEESTRFTPTAARAASAAEEASARKQYFIFRTARPSRRSTTCTRPRRSCDTCWGWRATDGRLIRPKDEPTTAKVTFDWCDVLAEGLVRSPELRKRSGSSSSASWSLIAAKNFLLPRLDLVGQYRWLGLGNRLDGANPLDLDQLDPVRTPTPIAR